MGRFGLYIIISWLALATVAYAQSGTVNARIQDGVGNKITSSICSFDNTHECLDVNASFTGTITVGKVDQGAAGSFPWLFKISQAGTDNNVFITNFPTGFNVNNSPTVKLSQTGTDNNVTVSSLPAIPTGTNVIGHVIADTGSTTAVTGNVTVIQPTGSNLHTVLDATSSTIVTQATGSNLHAVLDASTAVIGHVINDASTAVIGHVIADTGSTTAVTSLPALPSGSNVIGHVITDTNSTTAVTGNVTVIQPTGSNLHTVIDSGTVTTVTTLTGITNALPAGTNLLGKVGIDQTTPGTTNGVVPIFLRGAEVSDTRTATGDFSWVLDLQNYSYFVIQISGGVNGQFFVRCYTDSVNPPGNGYLLSLLRGTINSATSVTSNDIYYVWGTYRYNKCNLQSNSGGTPITVLATPMSGPLPPSPYVSAIIQNTGSNPVPVDNTTAGGAKESGGHLATIDTSTAALGAKTDDKSTATDTTSVSVISLLKEISAKVQAPPKTALTANSATFTTVGATHTSVLASNASRTGLILVNTSNNVISCGIGVNGVLNSGITLVPYGSFTMDAYSYSTQSIDCIASAGSSNLAVQEFQ